MNSLPVKTRAKLVAARALLLERHPYLAPAVHALTVLHAPGLGTLGVDQWFRLYVDSAPVDRWTIVELAAVLDHEIWHLLRDHPHRVQPWHEREKWLFATDMEINDDPDFKGIFTLPEGHIHPTLFGFPERLTAERYYKMLEEWVEKQPDGSGEGDGESAPNLSGGNAPPGIASRPGGQRDCGSCADGKPRPWEAEAPDSPSAPPGIDKAIAEVIRQEIAEAVLQRGDVPGEMKRWVDEVLHPRIPWQTHLKVALGSTARRASGAEDYTWAIPSRRRIPGVVLPAVVSYSPEVALVLDSSGSINDAQMKREIAETQGIVQAIGAAVNVLVVDAALHGGVQRVQRVEDIKLKGGGGTDMGLGIKEAAKLKPDIIIVMTDGETPWPKEPPDMKVIVLLVGKRVSESVPKWAQRIRVEEE
jgi:predicted metal-dependent peptidase